MVPNSDLKCALIACLEDEDVMAKLTEKLLGPLVSRAVAKVESEKNAEIQKLQKELSETKQHLNDLEQYSRKLCINISGVPEAGTGREDTHQIVSQLANAMQVEVTPEAIEASHRLGKATPSKTRPIIVRFTTLRKRQEFYEARKELRGHRAVTSGPFPEAIMKGIFVSDNLTRTNAGLMYVARSLKRSKKIHSAWSDQGKLKLRVKEGTPTKIFKTIEDLRKIVGDQPELDAPLAADPADSEDTGASEAAYQTVRSRRVRSAARR